jgi:hypothetical protein
MVGAYSRRNIMEYIKRNLKKGYTLESLRWALVNQGYSRTAVESAIQEVNKELAKKAPILKEKPVIRYEIIDENDNPIEIKRPFWKRIFGM